MSRTRIIWNIIAGMGAVGLSAFSCVRTYQRYYECSTCNVTDVAIGLSVAAFFLFIALWLSAISYCYIYRLIDEIACADGKFRFKCGSKIVENDSRVFLKFTLYSDESPEIQTHVLILLKSGPWLCPYGLWKDQVEGK